MDSSTGPTKAKVREYMRNEGRFRVVELQDPKRFEMLVKSAEDQAVRRLATYAQLSGLKVPSTPGEAE